jgi:hypothetical protein
MNRLSSEARAAVINCLIECCSIRSTSRMTGVSKPSVIRLLVEAGAIALTYQDAEFRNLNCERIQIGEIDTAKAATLIQTRFHYFPPRAAIDLSF